MIATERRVIRLTPLETTCRDHDPECPDVTDKLFCWLYDPGRGMCPWLRPGVQGNGQYPHIQEKS